MFRAIIVCQLKYDDEDELHDTLEKLQSMGLAPQLEDEGIDDDEES